MNVVLIDDDLCVLKSMELLLKERGHKVECFSNPIKALDTLSSIGGSEGDAPIIIVDYLMPEMNGLEFYKGIKNCDYKKIGILTGHFEELNEELIGDEGFHLFSKPIDIKAIFEFVEVEALNA